MNTLLVLLSSFVYFVSFPDKQGSTEVCLSQRALDQRSQWNIPIDSLDYEVSPAYLDSLRAYGLSIEHVSRWMNGATVKTTNARLDTVLNGLSWVSAIEMTRDNSPRANWYAPNRMKSRVEQESLTAAVTPPISTMATDGQLQLYNLRQLHRLGYYGQGILMTVCDGGFYNADQLGGLDSVRNRILGDFDFTDDTDDFYRSSNGSHGTFCLTAIAGRKSDYMGAATGAQYYLMRSEEGNSESPKEMDNWVAAVEKCDSLGVNVMSTSLGYFMFDNTAWNLSYADMNGINTRSSRAATIAARKGMLVVVAAGNEGTDSWHYISTPADADSILAVGAVDVDGYIASFSSYGPTSDGRVKPEACAVGYQTCLISPYNNSTYYGNGTSFACPLLAGMAATLWSALPDKDAQTIRQLIIESTDRYTHPDTHYGYGIPDAYAAYQAGQPTGLTTPDPAESVTDKVLYQGHLYIVRNGRYYTLTGEVVQ